MGHDFITVCTELSTENVRYMLALMDWQISIDDRRTSLSKHLKDRLIWYDMAAVEKCHELHFLEGVMDRQNSW